MLNALASQALQRAAEVVSALMTKNRPRLFEAERIAQQIAAVALSRGSIPSHEGEMSNSDYLRTLRRSLSPNSDLENAAVHLEGLVGLHDALILLDRALVPLRDTN